MRILRLRNIAQRLSPRRVLNLSTILLSYRVSTWTRKSIVWGMPFSVTIEPTNLCNLRCPECPSGVGSMTRPLGAIDMKDYRRLVDMLAPTTFYLQLFFQGEPFLHTNLIGMVDYARARKMYVSVSTNAHFIRNGMAERIVESGLDRLIISLDGVSAESYEAYRVGGNFQEVIAALDRLKEARAFRSTRTEVMLQFLVTRQNEGEIPRLRELARAYNTSVALKTIQVHSVEGAERFLPRDERYRRYRFNGEILEPKSRHANRCANLWKSSVVTWDGSVIPCCFDKDAQHPLGNVNESDFTDIWISERAHAFRRQILANRKGVVMCGNCTEGLRIYRRL